MSKSRSARAVMFLIFASFALVAGCHKKVASTPAVTRPPQPSTAPAATPPRSAQQTPSTETPHPAPTPSLEQLFQQDVRDAFFDYDKSDIRTNDQAALVGDADFMRSHPEVRFTIEGHCDERGSEEYNLALGDRRATAAKRYLVNMGIAENRIQTTSYGKERPFCTQQNESCWRENRRAHFTMAQ